MIAIQTIAIALFACFQDAPERGFEETLEWWREAIVLDLPGDVLRDEKDDLKRHPKLSEHGEAIALRARARLLAGDFDAARELLARANPTEATKAHVTVANARLELAEDNLEFVVKSLRGEKRGTVQDELSDLPDAWLVLGRALARADSINDSALVLRRFVELSPYHPEAASAWHILSRHATQGREFQRAQRFSARAETIGRWHGYYRAHRIRLRENADAIEPRVGLVILWMQADRPDKALTLLDELAVLAPDHCEAHGHRAEALRKLERFAEARKAYDLAIACAPDQAGLRFNRGWLALQEKREGDARVDFEWIVQNEQHEKDPRYLDAHLELARILMIVGEPEEAQKRYARYRELGGEQTLEK